MELKLKIVGGPNDGKHRKVPIDSYVSGTMQFTMLVFKFAGGIPTHMDGDVKYEIVRDKDNPHELVLRYVDGQ